MIEFLKAYGDRSIPLGRIHVFFLLFFWCAHTTYNSWETYMTWQKNWKPIYRYYVGTVTRVTGIVY